MATSIPSLSLYIITFNAGLELINTAAFASQLFNGLTGSLPDLLVLSLQEIAPPYCSFIGGSFLVPYFARIHDAVDLASKDREGSTYTSVAARNIGSTALMVFAKDAAAITGIETAGVGVGDWGMGNKGAVGVRILYRDTSSTASTELTFVSAHLAAMEWKLDRRNADWKTIVRNLVFSSTSQESSGHATSQSGAQGADEQPLLRVSAQKAGIYKPTSHLFVAGDLNYRTSTRSPSSLDHQDSFPQPHHSDSDSQHYSNLFEGDQLTREREAGRTLHGLEEAPITFPPTYKFTGNEDVLVPDEDVKRWSWASHRWPSWTDRILYLPVPDWLSRVEPNAEIIEQKYQALPLFPTSDHRAVVMGFRVPVMEIPEPDEDEGGEDVRLNPPFDLNPDWKKYRRSARKIELAVGIVAYLTGSWEGRLVVLGTVAGVVGGYFLLRAATGF